MATLSTVPTYPAPSRQTSVTFTLEQAGANYLRVWVTSAPPGSELRKKIDGTKDPRNRVEVYKGDGGANNPWRIAFDKGGKYTFSAQEYTRGASTFGGGYQDDPDGAPSETKLSSEYTLSLYIGQRIELPVGAGADTASLVLWVWDTTIRATTIAVHGEETPAIQSPSPSPRMQVVMESTSVQSALTDLAGVIVSTAIGTISSLVSDYLTDWNAHLGNGGGAYHDAADTANVLPVGFSIAPSANTLPDFVNEALRKLRQHYTNDQVDGGTAPTGRDSAGYHNVSGKKNDQTNMPVVQSVGDAGEAYIGLADLYRSFTAHMASTAVHDVADATNTLPSTTGAKLFELHKAVLAVLASTSPSVPATQSTGAMLLIQQAGGTESPL